MVPPLLMVKIAKIFELEKCIFENILEGPCGWSPHVCLATKGGPKAMDGHHITEIEFDVTKINSCQRN